MFKNSYTYNDIGIVPKRCSEIISRREIDASTSFLGIDLKFPLVSAPMRSVTGSEMSISLRKHGGLAFLPRSNDFHTDLNNFRIVREGVGNEVVVSIPATNDYMDRFNILRSEGAKYFCIDVANGFSRVVEVCVKDIQNKMIGHEKIITGNVGSIEGYQFLTDLGVDAVRVGIGNGSVCSTSVATGIGCGQASLVREIAEYRNKFRDRSPEASCPNHYDENNKILGDSICADCDKRSSVKKWPLIIADGGIKSPADVVKSITLGADVAMVGRIFAGVKESPGSVIKYNGKLYKSYAGEASFVSKQNDKFVEGDDTIVPYEGSLERVWSKFVDGMQSAMSYLNSKNIEELKFMGNDNFIILSNAAKIERNIHA